MKNKIIALITGITIIISTASAVFAATATAPDEVSWLMGNIWDDEQSNDEIFTTGTDEYISGVTVNVLDASTREQKYTAATDKDGNYNFTLVPGDYIIQFVVPEAYNYYYMRTYNSNTDMSEYADISGDGTVEYKFTAVNSTRAMLSSSLTKMDDIWLEGVVWYDANSNTIRPAFYDYEDANDEGENEVPVAGAIITVTNAAGEKVADGETDETGKYGFEVPAGKNTITVTFLPEAFKDYGFTTPENGTVTREFVGNDEVFVDFGINESANKTTTTTQETATPSPSDTPKATPSTVPSVKETPSPTVTPLPSATPEPSESPEPSETPVPEEVPTLNKTEHYAYVVGYEDGMIKPENNITRQEVATIFFRLLTDASRNYFYANDNTFTDVSQSLWSNIAISTMAKAKIVNGYNAATFMPLNNITRAEFATIAAKFDSSTYLGADKFTDISGHWAAEYINRAAEKGWISGYTDGTFKPDAYITRAEAMTLINNVLERHVTTDGMAEGMATWPDNTPDKWYYTPVQEAANSHYYEKNEEGVETWTELREPRDWSELER
ncbi:MAG: S-layer homology domain-containing protein [Clostridia bacterium]|nr:S-layer homology domain-containing protein [Clostridia bacterium]